MKDSTEDANFEDLTPESAKREVQIYRDESVVRREQNLFEEQSRALDPKPNGFLERMSPKRAIGRAKENTAALTDLTQQRTRLVEAHSDLIDATIHNRSAADIAREKVERILKAERALGDHVEQEARLKKIQADSQEQELRRRERAAKDEEARRSRIQSSLQQNDDLDAQIAREGKLLQLAQLRKQREAFQQASTATDKPEPSRRERTPSPELRALAERAETVKTIREHCDDQRIVLQRTYERGVIDEEQLEDGLEEIDRNEAWAIAAYEGRQEGGG